MFVPDSWQSHSEYVATLKNVKARFPSEFRAELFHSYSDARRKLFSLNIDPIGVFIRGSSPATVPAPYPETLLLLQFTLTPMANN